jgi:hypothetical protein
MSPVHKSGIAHPLIAHPLIAHNIEIAGEVAGLWHIEPNHDPTAGLPSRVWVALSQRGGTPLPLDQLQCQMTIAQTGTKPDQSDRPPIVLTPKAIAEPGQPSALGAMVTFPSTGAYDLRLACKPQPGSAIAAFAMDYEVTVARSTAPIPSPTASPIGRPTASPIAPPISAPSSPANPGFILLPLVLLGAIGLVLWSKLLR